MKKVLILTALFAVFFVLQGCSIAQYLKKNCEIQSGIGAKSFICFTCNFDNATPEMRKKIDTYIAKTDTCTIQAPK